VEGVSDGDSGNNFNVTNAKCRRIQQEMVPGPRGMAAAAAAVAAAVAANGSVIKARAD
jgi:hypothetical protein